MICNETEAAEYSGGTVSTRGNYRVGPFNGVYPVFPPAPEDYRTDCIPGLDDDQTPDAVAVFVHGFLVNPRQANATFGIARDSLRFHGDDTPLVGFSWDANEAVAIDDWYPTVLIARRNGRHLAQFVRDYRAANPDTEIRLIGHSLGVQVVLSALSRLVGEQPVENVTLLGGAVDDEVPGLSFRGYKRAIAEAANAVDNFYSTDDAKLRRYYPVVQFDVPLGGYGATGRPPDNYTDRDVSFVLEHLDYYDAPEGCMNRVIETWE